MSHHTPHPRRSGLLPGRVVMFLFLILLVLPGALNAPAHAASSLRAPSAAMLQNGSLVRDTTTGRISIIWSGQKHWINSPTAFAALGYDMSSVSAMSAADLAAIPEGNAIGPNLVADGRLWPFAPVRADPVQLVLGATTVAPGQTLPLQGSGFKSGEVVTVTGSAGAITLAADSSGSFRLALPVAGNVGMGLHQLYAVGNQSGLFGVQVYFVAPPAPAPTFTHQPDPVHAGTNLLLSGAGFMPGEEIQVFVAGPAAAAVTSANGSGAFGPFAILVPANLAGAHTLVAYGASSHRSAEGNVMVIAAQNAPPATPTTVPTPLPNPTPVPYVAPHLYVNPASASPGAQVLVWGSGFTPGEVVLVRFNGILLEGTAVNSAGDFGASLVAVPSGLATGVYSLSATGSNSGKSATTSISVVAIQPVIAPSIAVSPINVIAGGHVTVAGTGFKANETVVVYFNNSVQENVTANANGSFTNGGFVVPVGMTPGSYSVRAVGAASSRSAGATLTVSAAPVVLVPQVFLSSSAVNPGAQISVTGRGFGSQETILVRIDGALVVPVTTDPSGSFSLSLTAPQAYGNHILSVTGARSGLTAAIGFTVLRPVTPGIGLIPNWAYRGGQVLVNGTSFVPGEVVLIDFRGVLVQAVKADANGRFFQASFQVPTNTPLGYSTIKLTGSQSGRVATALLQVKSSAPAAAHLTVSVKSAHRGNVVRLSGSGFDAREIVLVSYRGRLVMTFTTSAQGTFSKVALTIPTNSPYGKATISLVGARSNRKASTTVQITQVIGASVSVTPKSLHRGAVVRLSGHGFDAREIVLVSYRGRLVKTFTTSAQGTFSNVGLTIPTNSPYGKATISLVGTRSNRKAATTVQITKVIGAGMTVAPTVAHRGASMTVTGHGFVAHETVLIYLRGTLVQAVTADKNGNFGRTKFTVPGSMHTGVTTLKLVGAQSGRHVQVSVVII